MAARRFHSNYDTATAVANRSRQIDIQNFSLRQPGIARDFVSHSYVAVQDLGPTWSMM